VKEYLELWLKEAAKPKLAENTFRHQEWRQLVFVGRFSRPVVFLAQHKVRTLSIGHLLALFPRLFRTGDLG
jgi:hypothetical protein